MGLGGLGWGRVKEVTRWRTSDKGESESGGSWVSRREWRLVWYRHRSRYRSDRSGAQRGRLQREALLLHAAWVRVRVTVRVRVRVSRRGARLPHAAWVRVTVRVRVRVRVRVTVKVRVRVRVMVRVRVRVRVRDGG